LNAQQDVSVPDKKADSLFAAFAVAKDTGKVTILLGLGSHYVNRGDMARALQYARQALALVEKKSVEKKKGSALMLNGNILHAQTKYAEADPYYSKALAFFEAANNKKAVAGASRMWGMNFYFMERYPEAVNLLYKALKLYEELGDKKNIIAVLRGLSACLSYQDKQEEALGYNIRALKITEELKDTVNITSLYNEIGMIYSEVGNYNEAIQYHNRALEMNRKLGEKVPVWALAFNYECLGIAYQKKGDDKDHRGEKVSADSAYKEALKNLILSYKEWELIEKEKTFPMSDASIGSLQISIGIAYYKLGDFAKAKSSILSGLPVSIGKNAKAYLSSGYLFLSKIDSLEGNFSAAYQHYKLYDRYQDSIFNDEDRKKIEQYKNQYVVDKKEQEITLLATENKLKTVTAEKQSQQKKIAYAGIALLLLAGVAGFFVYRRNHLLNAEQAKLKDRLMISQDLHDSIGSTLSSISVYSQVAKIQGEKSEKEDLNELLEKISSTSNEMVGEMNDIVWAINPRNDNMEKIIQRMESFARPLAAARNIRFDLAADPSIASLQLDMEKRKNFYLIFKEAVTNAIKYSGASELVADIHAANNKLVLTVKDNGVGFNPENEMGAHSNSLSGNGLKNMHARAAELNGELTILSQPGKGTAITLHIPLA